ncbi:MAG: hypothetical protein M1592_03740 [Candidatus Thermoplasmatota archaeon]|nr:hypothetical protein [Candidatus Thermoplasmatota archaeon]
MLVRDIDKKLDMRIVLRVRQSTEFFGAIADLKTKLPVFIYGKNGETWMSTYFQRDSRNSKIDMLLSRFHAVEKEDSFVVDARINNVKDLAVINRLIHLPSFIVNRSDMSRGFINIYARFHSSQSDAVSSLLAEYTSDGMNARVDWLGPSPGITSIMDLINSEYPISLITYELPMNGEEDPIRAIMSDDVMAEVSSSPSTDGTFTTVLYSRNPIHGNIEGISPVYQEDGIYGLNMRNSFFIMVRDRANEEHIMRTRSFIRPVDGKLQVTVFLPTASIYEYYSIIFEIARKTDNRVAIRHLLPYTHDVWDFI